MIWKMPYTNSHLTSDMKHGMILVLTMGTVKGVNMTKYKLYKFSTSMYVVPLDEYDYVDEIVESYFMDYCAGILTSHQLDSFVEECIIDNGGKCFDIWCDDYYVVMNKE